MAKGTKNPPAEAAAGVPAYLAGEESVPMGHMDNEEGVLKPPRFTVMQGTSDLVKDETAQPGTLWSEAHQQSILRAPKKDEEAECIQAVILKAERSWMLFNDERQLVWNAVSQDDSRVVAHGDSWALETYHFLMLAPLEHPELPAMPAIWSMRSYAKRDCGKPLYNEMRMKKLGGKQAPFFSQIYRFWLVKGAKGGKSDGNYYPRHRFVSFVPEEQGAELLDLARQFSGSNIIPETIEANGATTKPVTQEPEPGSEDDLPF